MKRNIHPLLASMTTTGEGKKQPHKKKFLSVAFQLSELLNGAGLLVVNVAFRVSFLTEN